MLDSDLSASAFDNDVPRVTPQSGRGERVAVIGSGIAGLTTAYLLSDGYDVTVYEARDRLGGHTHTARFDLEGRPYSVDTGFIVYNDWTYPNFIKLMKRLDVETQASEMSFSVRDEKSGLEYNGHTINTLFAQRTNMFRPSFHRMIREILRFNREAKELLTEENAGGGPTIGEYLDAGRYSREFVDRYIAPMGAAIWSTSTTGIRSFPARQFARFFENHGMLSVDERPVWRVVKGGSDQYIAPITEPFRERVRLGTPVERITRSPNGVTVRTTEGHEERFDHVVIASHSDQALRMLGDASESETRVLGAIPYTANDVVLHHDERLLPKKRLAWAAWNYHLLGDADSRGAQSRGAQSRGAQSRGATVSYYMNRLQSIESPHEFVVTLNRSDAIRADRVLRALEYHHPAYSTATFDAQSAKGEISGVRRTWYCGAYWGWGFHEDGVNSALAVATGFGKTL